MKAAYVEQVGPPEALIYGDQPEPEPGPNDVKIRVRATSLNRLDIFMRAGSHGTRITPPEILGRDIGGEVVAVGSAVQGLQPGNRVVASGSGSYAEYALAPFERTFLSSRPRESKIRSSEELIYSSCPVICLEKRLSTLNRCS